MQRKRRTRYAALISVASVVVLTGCACWADSPRQADELAISGKWADVKAALAGQVTDPRSNLVLGYASLAQGDYREATEAFSRLGGPQTPKRLLDWAKAIAQEHPQSAIAQMLKGDALARSGEYDEALAALDETIHLDPRSALMYDVRGVMKALAGKTESATEDFDKAIELEPGFADAYVGRGLVRLSEGDWDGALEALTKAIELAPEFALAYNGRGAALCALEMWEEAEADFQKAAKLAPGLPLAKGNLGFLAWAKAEAEFQMSQRTAEGEDARGTTLIAQSYERQIVDLGAGRTMDLFVIKPTEQTATLTGMRSVLSQIRDQVRTEAHLRSDWEPNILVAQPGLGSSAYAERLHSTRTAHQAGRDFVVAFDTTRWFQRSRVLSGDTLPEASQFFARGIAAINQEFGRPPDLLANSQATRMAAVEVGRLYEERLLPPDIARSFKINTAVFTGAPLPAMKMPERYRQECFASAPLTITTPSPQPFIASQPIAGTRSIELLDGNRGVDHGRLNDPMWGNRMNPIPELAALHFRGISPPIIQSQADRLGRGREIPMYTVPQSEPLSVALSMSSMAEKGLISGDRVLIGCADARIADAMSDVFRRTARPVEWRPITDPAGLQRIAQSEGYTRILLVRPGGPDDLSKSLIGDTARLSSAPLPSLRPLAQNIERFDKAVNLLYDVAGRDLAPEMKVPLAFTAPIIQDLRSARAGQFSPLTSQTLERVGELGLKQMPRIVDALKQAGRLPASFNLPPTTFGIDEFVAGGASQLGRGTWRPSVDEVTRYLDGLNKMSWAVVGYLKGGPKAARIAESAAGLTADVLRGATEPLFQRWAHDPVRKQMLSDWRTHVEAATARGVPAKTFTEMFTPRLVTQVGFDTKTVAELDNYTSWANASAGGKTMRPTIPTGVPDLSQLDPAWKRPYIDLTKRYMGPFPPDKFGGAGVPSYRLPSTDLLGDKRGGVKLKADVVKGQPADTSGIFGGEGAATGAGSREQQGLLCPFLLFCAAPQGG